MFDIYIYIFLKSGFNQLDSWFWSVVKPMPKGFLYHFRSDLLQSNDPLGILLAGCQRFRRRSAPGFHLAISCGLQTSNGSQDESALEGLVNARSPDSVPWITQWCRCRHVADRSPEDRLTPRITRLFGRLLEDLALLPFWEGQARPFPKLE